jgi:hypothetical protein
MSRQYKEEEDSDFLKRVGAKWYKKYNGARPLSDRSSFDCGSDGSDLGQAQWPNLPFDINQLTSHPSSSTSQPSDAELILTIHVSNPNIVPIHYSSTIMSIFYEDSLLGSAQVEAGSQLKPRQKTDQLARARQMKVLLCV